MPQRTPLDSASLVAFIIIAVFLVLFITYMAMKVGKLIASKSNGSGGCCRSKRPKIPKAHYPCDTVPIQLPVVYKVYQESPAASEASSDSETDKSEATYPRGLGIFVEETDGSGGKDSIIRRSQIPTVTSSTIRSGGDHAEPIVQQ